MSEEKKETIERCKELIKPEHANWIGITNQLAIETIIKKYEKQQSELEKKDKMIDEMAPQIYLTKEQREEMKEYIWTSNKPKDFKSFVKQYFERKVE